MLFFIDFNPKFQIFHQFLVNFKHKISNFRSFRSNFRRFLVKFRPKFRNQIHIFLKIITKRSNFSRIFLLNFVRICRFLCPTFIFFLYPKPSVKKNFWNITCRGASKLFLFFFRFIRRWRISVPIISDLFFNIRFK